MLFTYKSQHLVSSKRRNRVTTAQHLCYSKKKKKSNSSQWYDFRFIFVIVLNMSDHFAKKKVRQFLEESDLKTVL